MKQWVKFCIILVLSSYIALDIYIHSPTATHDCGCPKEVPQCKEGVGLQNVRSLKGSTEEGKGDEVPVSSDRDGEGDVGVWDCAIRDGHREATSGDLTELGKDMAWRQMKWIGKAASCRVKGHLIEKLDDVNDFRRGYALKFADSVEDKTLLLPWLLAAREPEMGLRRRRVYLDLGAGSFDSSVEWFLRMYPLDFTEVHAFEPDSHLWPPPHNIFDEEANLLPAHVPIPNAIRVNSTPGIPEWMMEHVKVHYRRVSHRDDESTNSTDITRFIKEELCLTPADTVVVKMDIEGAEWPILTQWINDPQMPQIIDDLFVEVHYASPTMIVFGWDSFAPLTRDDALSLLADLRWHGFYAHFWP